MSDGDRHKIRPAELALLLDAAGINDQGEQTRNKLVVSADSGELRPLLRMVKLGLMVRAVTVAPPFSNAVAFRLTLAGMLACRKRTGHRKLETVQ